MNVNTKVIDAIDTYYDTNKKIKTMTYVNQCVLSDIYDRVQNYYNGSSLLLFREEFISKVSEYLVDKDKTLKPNYNVLTEQIEDVFFSCKMKIKIKNIVFQGLDSWGYEVKFSVNNSKTDFALKIPLIENMNMDKFLIEDFGKMTSLYCSNKNSNIDFWNILLTSYNTKELGDSILQFIESGK